MSQHKYSGDYVAPVRVQDAREFLTNTGLPADHVLFAAAEAKTEEADGRSLLPIGSGDPDAEDVYCVDCASGEVVYLIRVDGTATHVSASPRQFDDLLRVFASETTAVGDDPEDIAERLRLRIENIDPTALEDDPGFWVDALFDVANGDYTDDED
jgi:SUKH-4 immunity protein of toxin-antitoxin system